MGSTPSTGTQPCSSAEARNRGLAIDARAVAARRPSHCSTEPAAVPRAVTCDATASRAFPRSWGSAKARWMRASSVRSVRPATPTCWPMGFWAGMNASRKSASPPRAQSVG